MLLHLSSASAAGGSESFLILQIPHRVDQAVIFFLPVYLCISWAWPSPNAFITDCFAKGILHCFSLRTEGLCRTPFPGEGDWLGTGAGMLRTGLPQPVQVLIALQMLPVTEDFLCKEISEEAAAESVCYGICGLWSAAGGVHSSKTTIDLLPGGAGPLGQDH